MSKTLSDYLERIDGIRKETRKVEDAKRNLRREKNKLIREMQKDIDNEEVRDEVETLIRSGDLEEAEDVLEEEKSTYTVS